MKTSHTTGETDSDLSKTQQYTVAAFLSSQHEAQELIALKKNRIKVSLQTGIDAIIASRMHK